MRGAEWGPFYSPTAPKADGWKTIVIDYTSGDELRRIARTHSEPSIRSCENRIEDVDIIWSGGPIGDRLLSAAPKGLDFIIASHVIEHIPDLVGFFQQLSMAIKSNGVISLAVPDMRFCFDFFKSPSSTAELMTAHRERRMLHTPENIFQAHGYGAFVNGAASWLRDNLKPPKLVAGIAHAKTQYLEYLKNWESQSPQYHDAHCWFFTPSSFQLVMLELKFLGLIDLDVAHCEINPGAEFMCQLQRSGPPIDDIDLKREELFRGTLRELAERPISDPVPRTI